MQRHNSKQRGIKFEFEYEDWLAWWREQLGPNWLLKRGCKKGQYVMARNRDKGSYIRGNVKAITAEENVRRYCKRREVVNAESSTATWKVLSKEIVKAIYFDQDSYSDIVKKYDGSGYRITKHKIQCIKQKHYFKKLTDALDAASAKRRRMKDVRLGLKWIK